MEFGKAATIEELDRIDFTLPEDDPLTSEFLGKQKTSEPNPILIGAPAWGRKEWVGSIYPAGTRAADFLFHYAQNFDTIELNTTHYRIPEPDQAKKWVEKVRRDFLFCPKVFQEISHTRTGLVNKELLAEWFRFLENLGSHLGPCFIQFPPGFGYDEKAILFQFLKLWPDDLPLALEFRHPSWFEGHRVLSALVEYLQSRKIGLVITDVAGRRDVLHTSVTSDHCLVRFVGNDLHPTDLYRAKQWVDRLTSWNHLGLKKPILFLHQPDDIRLPDIARVVRQLLGRPSLQLLD